MYSYHAPSVGAAPGTLHSSEDLRRRWLALMNPLGFGRQALWMTFVTADRRMEKALTQFPAQSYDDWLLVFSVIVDLSETVDQMIPGSEAAFLFSRPGSGTAVSDEDLHWADMVLGAAEMHGLPIAPFFRVNDSSVVRVVPGN